jgi:methionyl-tRNA formyltransferase
MRIVFMGTPEFAVASLDLLVKNDFEVVGVVTVPDKPAGRGRQLQVSPVKEYALRQGLPLLQPEKLKDPEFLDTLRSLKADLQVVVAFRMLPEQVWNMPPLGTYNLHASLLPRYRGAAPINWAVIQGEKETGVTTFRLKHEIDTGNILFQEKVNLPETMTAGELYQVLMDKGAHLLLKTVREIGKSQKGESDLSFSVQEESGVSHAPKLVKETGHIDWNRPVKEIYNLIRGLSPYPGAYTHIRSGDRVLLLKIFSAVYEPQEHQEAAGRVVSDDKAWIRVYGAGGVLVIRELQLEGKKRMPAGEFLKGFKIPPGTLLT